MLPGGPLLWENRLAFATLWGLFRKGSSEFLGFGCSQGRVVLYTPLQAWHFYGSTNTDPGAFLAENDDYSYLIIPRVEAEAVASLGDKELLSTRSAEIKACYNSSQSGERLYSCAMRALVEEELATVIRDRLKELEASKTPITQYAVAEWQRITVGKIEAISGLATISGRRTCLFDYRGFTIQLLCKSPVVEAEMAVWCFLRARAASQGILPGLPAESELATDVAGQALPISQELFKKSCRARTFLSDCLKELPEEQRCNGDSIEASVGGTCTVHTGLTLGIGKT